MQIIKRSGQEVLFDREKIKLAILKTNHDVLNDLNKISEEAASEIALNIENYAATLHRALSVEEIQDEVEIRLMKYYPYVAKEYITYRNKHNERRKQNTTDAQILSTVNLENEEVKQENSNKDPIIIPTQRDYVAGLVSRDLTDRYLLPAEITDAHQKGIIHFHDSDYFIQRSHNCDVWNLEDMLQNGTVINKTMIERPHSFATACNITTQIMAQVASSQYGGQTITLSHLAPFVDISRQKIRQDVQKELSNLDSFVPLEELNDTVEMITEKRVKEEISRGVQTMQYQINTLMTCNGQTPFVSVFMYLNEVEDPRTKEDLALVIEEVLNQRIQGTKNEKGIWITPAFPKLLYVLEDDNISSDGKYYYLTKLAAQCTAKRMVPDYISEKKMKEYKISEYGSHDCYPCMGKRKL